jgi:predicted nucleic acid-binding protein
MTKKKKKTKKEITTLTIEYRRPLVTGKKKIAIDTNIIINLIDNPECCNYLDTLLKESDLFYTHEICVGEAKDVLSKKPFNYSRIEAQSKVDDFIKKYSITIIKRNPTNKRLAWELVDLCKSCSIDLHPPDNFILADWKKAGITHAYTQDDELMDACNLVGIVASRLFDLKSEDEEKIRKFFKKMRS